MNRDHEPSMEYYYNSMASHASLRQAARVVQSNRSHLKPSRTRQYSRSAVSHPFLPSRPAANCRRFGAYQHHVLQQTRNLSWWGSGSSTSTNVPTDAAVSQDPLVTTPADLQNTIIQGRSFKASQDLSSAEVNPETHSTPNAFEPQILEDVQRAVTEPHLTDPASTPTNLEDIPERIGYLKEVCGIDFGWGPSSTVQYVFEHLHITGEYSWTVSIILLGLTVRGMIFPLLIGSAKESQKMRDMKDVLAPIQAEYTSAKERQDTVRMTAAAKRLMAVRKEFGLKIWKALLPPFLQIPFGFGCWRLLRNCATLPVPGFVSESWLWTTDLSYSDPFFITPMVSAVLIWATIKSNSRVTATPASENVLALLQKAMPILSLIFMSFQPGAVQLYFVSSSAAGLASALILQQGPVRKFFKMPPLPDLANKKPTGPPTASASAVSSIPSPPPTITGGLYRRSYQERAKDAQRAAQLAAQTAEQQKRSVPDKGVDFVKKQYSDLKGTVAKIGSQIGLEGKQRDWMKDRQAEKEQEYEARIRERLDERRKERNARNSRR